MPDIAEYPIRGGIFAPIEATGSFYAIEPYPRKSSTMTMLEALLEDLGISAYRLAKLLGMNHPVSVYSWTSGSQNPSPYYLTLMLELRHLAHTRQIDLRIIDSINWVTGEIRYKGQGKYDTGKNAVSPAQRTLPGRGNRGRGASALISAQPSG